MNITEGNLLYQFQELNIKSMNYVKTSSIVLFKMNRNVLINYNGKIMIIRFC